MIFRSGLKEGPSFSPLSRHEMWERPSSMEKTGKKTIENLSSSSSHVALLYPIPVSFIIQNYIVIFIVSCCGWGTFRCSLGRGFDVTKFILLALKVILMAAATTTTTLYNNSWMSCGSHLRSVLKLKWDFVIVIGSWNPRWPFCRFILFVLSHLFSLSLS